VLGPKDTSWPVQRGALLVFDITDPAQPSHVGTFETEGAPAGLALAGNTAYVSATGQGLLSIDITDPSTPTRVGAADTGECSGSVELVDHRAYVKCGDFLDVVDVTDQTHPVLERDMALPSDANLIAAFAGKLFTTSGNHGRYEPGTLTLNVLDPEPNRCAH
jgi:hypothetical protein